MPRQRHKDQNLPTRVYRKGGAFYYVSHANRWIRLGATLPEMYSHYAEVLRDADRKPLKALFDRYTVEVLPSKAPKTRHEQLRQLTALADVFGGCYPEAVKPSDVARYLDQRSAKIAANREIALLSHVFRKAIRWGLVESNPCQGVERNKEKPDGRYIDDGEFWAVHEQAPVHIRSAMELAYLTGQRQADVLDLQRGHLRDTGIYFRQAKTGKELIVRWSPELRAAVDRALGAPCSIASVWLIHNRKGQKYTSSGFQGMWQKLMHRCLAEKVVQHRFTFRAIRAKARSDGPDKRLLGHSNPDAMSRIYMRKPELVQPVK